MRNKIIPAILLSALCSFTAQAVTVVTIMDKSGSTKEYNIDDSGKLYFSGDALMINEKAGAKDVNVNVADMLAGISVLTVDPRYTSQTCSGCGAIGTRHRHRFACPNCGLRAHSDLNASRNLRGLGYLLIAQGLP